MDIDLPESVKSMPIKLTIGSIVSIITLIGGVYTMDTRYAHTADVQQTNTKLEKLIIHRTTDIRRKFLEDKLFELDLLKTEEPGKFSRLDQALHDHYQQELIDLNTRDQDS